MDLLDDAPLLYRVLDKRMFVLRLVLAFGCQFVILGSHTQTLLASSLPCLSEDAVLWVPPGIVILFSSNSVWGFIQRSSRFLLSQLCNSYSYFRLRFFGVRSLFSLCWSPSVSSFPPFLFHLRTNSCSFTLSFI